MKSLIEVDQKYNTSFDLKFNSEHIRDYLTYVEAEFGNDYLRFIQVKTQFDALVASSSNTLIKTDLILSVIETDFGKKLSAIVNHISEYFKNNQHTYHDPDIEAVKARLANLNLKLEDYYQYYTDNYEELMRYIRYQNYIHEGNDYLKFEEFEG